MAFDLLLQKHMLKLGYKNTTTAYNYMGALRARSDLHLMRKLWHMSMGVLIVSIYLAGMPSNFGVLLLSVALAITLIVETLRLKYPIINEKFLNVWSPLMRSHEVNRMSTVIPYILAAIIAVGVFPKPVAVLSILYLACGDPLASLFGILYGNRSIRFKNGKSLIGTMAGVFVCMMITFVFLLSSGFPMSSVLPISIIGGLAGGTAEWLPFDVDDNLSIPVISGFMLWLTFIFFAA